MYATVRSYSESSELVDVLLANESEIKGLIGGIAGFRAYYLLRTAGGDAVSVSVFDDQAGAEESNRVAAEWVGANAPGLSVGPPRVSAGEVIISA